MKIKYQDVMNRWQEERKRLGWRQKDICHKIHIMQGHYSRAESGEKRFTYRELQELAGTEFDLHYVYTGERLFQSQYYSFLRHMIRI